MLRAVKGSVAWEYMPKLVLNFNMNAALYLEHVFGDFGNACRRFAAGSEPSAAYHFLRAGLMFLHESENDRVIRTKGLDYVLPDASMLRKSYPSEELETLRPALLRALSRCLPEAQSESGSGSDSSIDFIALFLVWTTQIGLPPESFWKATLREFFQIYAAFKTLKFGDDILTVSEFDEDPFN